MSVKLEEISKLSELLELAIKDIHLAIASGDFIPNMGTWLCQIPITGKCEGCLAGAVLLMEVYQGKAAYNYSYLWDDLSEELENRMAALNSLRLGDIQDAAKCLEISIDRNIRSNRIAPSNDINELISEWDNLLEFLKSKGL